MITANNLRVGMTVEIDSVIYVVEEFEHVKRGRGGAFVRCRLKDVETLENVRKILQPEEKIKDIFVEEKKAQYLYREGNNFYFMDIDSFEEKTVPLKLLKDKVNFLKESMEVTLCIGEGKIIGINLPAFVELKVKKSLPGVKGDTVGSATKMVTLESGYSLRVPIFIKEGDIVRVDTRSGKYIGKA